MISYHKYNGRFVNFLEIIDKCFKISTCMFYPLEVISHFIFRIFALIIRLMILHSCCVQEKRFIGFFNKLFYLIENCFIFYICTVIFDRYCKIFIKNQLIKTKICIDSFSAVERTHKRVYIGS